MTHDNTVDKINLQHERLLSSVAEHLKQPLLYTRQAAELAESGTPMSPAAIRVSADAGLLLVEHFLTWQRNTFQHQSLAVSQVGLTAVMHEVSEGLRQFASLHQTSLRLAVRGKYAPVMTNSKVLASGLSALGLAFIEAAQAQDDENDVVFAVHKTRWGIVAGVYSPNLSVRADAFQRQKKLTGTARQLLPATSHTPMSGVAIADALFAQLAVKLRPSRHKNMDGLAVTLAPSPQLSLL